MEFLQPIVIYTYLKVGNQPSRAPSALVWQGLVPHKVEAFCWLAVATKVSTADNLRIRGLTTSNISDICVMCQEEEETINHLFLLCKSATAVWNHLFPRCGIAWCYPRSIGEAGEAWLLRSCQPSSRAQILMKKVERGWSCFDFP